MKNPGNGRLVGVLGGIKIHSSFGLFLICFYFNPFSSIYNANCLYVCFCLCYYWIFLTEQNGQFILGYLYNIS